MSSTYDSHPKKDSKRDRYKYDAQHAVDGRPKVGNDDPLLAMLIKVFGADGRPDFYWTDRS